PERCARLSAATFRLPCTTHRNGAESARSLRRPSRRERAAPAQPLPFREEKHDGPSAAIGPSSNSIITTGARPAVPAQKFETAARLRPGYFSRNILLLTTYRTMSPVRYPPAFNLSPSCFKYISSPYVNVRPVAYVVRCFRKLNATWSIRSSARYRFRSWIPATFV